ncbi:MAG: zinc ribbon domain-containing protein [Methanomassiliicoccus sp.]|nr:zinc ribbon domain-containing protein [Methanomassiliicoccus sp.]
MRCTNCGNENSGGSAFCMECGTRLGAAAVPAAQPANGTPPPAPQPAQPQNWQPAYAQAPQNMSQQYDQGPPPGYVPPYQQVRPRNVPTVRTLHLGEVLLLIAGAFLIGVGFDNLEGFYRAQYILLGLVSLVGGLIFLGKVIVPDMLRPLDQFMDLLILGMSGLFVLWGLVAVFADNAGWLGGFLVSAGLLGLASAGLKMGILK